MIELKIRHPKGHKSNIYVDIEVFYPEIEEEQRIFELNWEEKIKELTASQKRVVFCIKKLDNDGIISVILRLWLRYCNLVLVKTSEPVVKTVLSIMHKEKIKFVDE